MVHYTDITLSHYLNLCKSLEAIIMIKTGNSFTSFYKYGKCMHLIHVVYIIITKENYDRRHLFSHVDMHADGVISTQLQ
jgi:hypothetical protein